MNLSPDPDSPEFVKDKVMAVWETLVSQKIVLLPVFLVLPLEMIKKPALAKLSYFVLKKEKFYRALMQHLTKNYSP